MVIVNCLWVGVLAGLVGSRLIRTRSGIAPTASGLAVGVLGALVGGLAAVGKSHASLPHVDIMAAGGGAAAGLALWAAAQRALRHYSRDGESGGM